METTRLARLLDADPFARGLGVEVVEVGASTFALGLDLTDDHANFLGATHGGVVFALADIGLSLASNAERTAVAIDAHVVYTGASAPGDRLRADVEPVREGSRVGTHRVTITRSDGRVVAVFTGTVLNT